MALTVERPPFATSAAFEPQSPRLLTGPVRAADNDPRLKDFYQITHSEPQGRFPLFAHPKEPRRVQPIPNFMSLNDARPRATRELITQVRSVLADPTQEKIFLIRGTYRAGKTTIAALCSLWMKDNQEAIPFKIDALFFTSSELDDTADNFEDMMRYSIIKGFSEAVDHERFKEEWQENWQENGVTALESLDQWLGEKNLKSVVSFDEFMQVFQRKPVMAEHFARTIKKLKNIVTLVDFHYFQNIEDKVVEAFPKTENYIFVKPLNRDEALEYTREVVLASSGYFTGISGAALDEIYDITGGRPIEINAMLHHLARLLGLGRNRQFIDHDLLRDHRLELLKDLVFTRESKMAGSYGVFFSGHLSVDQQGILRRLARWEAVPIGSVSEADYKPLIQVGWVREESGHLYMDGEALRTIINQIPSK